MAKRRRVEESGGDNSSWEQPSSSSQRLPFPQFPITSDYANSTAEVADTSAVNALSQDPNPNAYPEVAAYTQQPYFFQQTDPSTYTSRWPPGDRSGSFVTQSNVYSGQAVAGAMPYFPTSQNGMEVEQNGLATNSVQSLLQDYQPEIEATTASQQNVFNQIETGQQRGDRTASQSSLYYDDASMHIKSQSLPILNNLVRQYLQLLASSDSIMTDTP